LGSYVSKRSKTWKHLKVEAPFKRIIGTRYKNSTSIGLESSKGWKMGNHPFSGLKDTKGKDFEKDSKDRRPTKQPQSTAPRKGSPFVEKGKPLFPGGPLLFGASGHRHRRLPKVNLFPLFPKKGDFHQNGLFTTGFNVAFWGKRVKMGWSRGWSTFSWKKWPLFSPQCLGLPFEEKGGKRVRLFLLFSC
jgi:hypothetical protein